jgi:tRNA(Arg) A34 adenosine deaminase TadA
VNTHEDFMRRAIELSREEMNAGAGGPFAALVVLDGEIVGEGWNRVTSSNDPTAHAEIGAIRDACARLGRFSLDGAVLYTSCEPCPMCLAAIYWARIERIYYGNSTTDASAIGFADGRIYHQISSAFDQREIPCERILPDEALQVFREWEAKPDKVMY